MVLVLRATAIAVVLALAATLVNSLTLSGIGIACAIAALLWLMTRAMDWGKRHYPEWPAPIRTGVRLSCILASILGIGITFVHLYQKCRIGNSMEALTELAISLVVYVIVTRPEQQATG